MYGEDVKPEISSVWSCYTPYQNFIVLASGFAQSRQVLRELRELREVRFNGEFYQKKEPETGLVPATKSLIASQPPTQQTDNGHQWSTRINCPRYSK